MKLIILFLSLVILTSCSNEHFFQDFDEVEYYSIKKDLPSFEESNDSILEAIVYGEYPLKNEDSIFYSKLNSEKYFKFKFSGDDIDLLKDVFSKRTALTLFKDSYGCAPIFRDVLVLRRNKQIVGVAKICLECDKHYFIGNNKNVSSKDFGMKDEYLQLKSIFKKYKLK